jgi:hypothetical protein
MAASDLQLCFDRVVPTTYAPVRATLERAMAMSDMTPSIEIDAADPEPAVRLAVPFLKMWENGRTLKCRFLDGSPTQKRRVEEKAHQWVQYANITFKFVRSGPAEIRISFEADPGSWSALGTDALIESYFPRYQPTMNYGWLEDDTSDEEYIRVVVHEFGHALGAIHEHQSPEAALKWNKPEVYRRFSGPPNYWSKADIDHNVFARYKKEQTNASKFDKDSIMLYEFPGSLFTDGQGTARNMKLSAGDRSFIKKIYPGRR